MNNRLVDLRYSWNLTGLNRYTAFALWLLIFTVSSSSHATIRPTDIAIPAQFGSVEKRVEGASEKPFIFLIGEDHASLKVQQAVSDSLRYLAGIYDLKLVCTEGYDKPFEVSVSKGNESLVAQRSIARADFNARRISGVEYFARAHPDIAVIGVEDMNAYKQHALQLDSQDQIQQSALQESEKWIQDFQDFLQKDVANLQVSDSDAQKIVNAYEELKKKRDFTAFSNAIFDVVGRNSEIGQKLAGLIDRNNSLETLGKAINEAANSVGSSPEMESRNRAMVAGTLRAIQEKKVDAAILVVGKFHLPGIEKLLDTAKVSYVNILPLGMDDKDQDVEQAIESHRIYQARRKGQPMGIETWFLSSKKIKDTPAIARLEARDRNSFLNILMSAYNLKNQSISNEQVLAFINDSGLPSGAKIDKVFDIEGGYGFEFTINGYKGYAYFSSDPKHIIPLVTGKEPIEKGEGGRMSYAIYEGGGGGSHPPIPPKSGGGNGFWGPNFNWHNNYVLAIGKEKEHQKQRVTILFYFDTDQDALRRQVDNGTVEVLDVNPLAVKTLLSQYEKAPLGPEKNAAAMKLSDVLLVDLNKHLPEGKTELILISKNDLLGETSLITLQSFAGEESADHLQTITTDYVIPWSKRESSLTRLGEKLENFEQVKKDQAKKQQADKEIKDKIGNEPLRRGILKLTDAEKSKIAPQIQVRSQATVI